MWARKHPKLYLYNDTGSSYPQSFWDIIIKLKKWKTQTIGYLNEVKTKRVSTYQLYIAFTIMQISSDFTKVFYGFWKCFLPENSVADPDPVPFWPLDPGIRDPEWVFSGSRIPNPYFWELSENFWVKSSIILWKLAQFFSSAFKIKIIYNFVKFDACDQKFFFTPLFSCCFWSGIRYPGSEIQDPQCCGSGSGIRCLFDPWIRDPGSGIRNRVFSGSWIPDPKAIFLRA